MTKRAVTRVVELVLVALGGVGAFGSVGPVALAQVPAEETATDEAGPSEQDKARALDKYTQGQAAFDAKRFKDAVDLFLDGDRIIQNPSFAFNIGLSYEQMGDDAQALRWFREYARRDPGASDRSDVMDRIVRYEKKLQAKGLQQVTVLSQPAGATVVVDGQPVGVSPWTGEIAPGSHELVLRLQDHQDGTTQFALAPDRAMDVSLTLGRVQAPPPSTEVVDSGPTPPPTVDESSAGISDIGPVTWIMFGVGLGAMGASLGLEMVRAGAVDDAAAAPTQVDALDHYDRAENMQLGARIAVAAGGATLLAGGVLLYLDLSGSGDQGETEEGTAQAPSARLRLGCRAGICDLGLTGQF